jgi:putative addiction module component (TIGR02574 family)
MDMPSTTLTLPLLAIDADVHDTDHGPALDDELKAELKAELDRRIAIHEANPERVHTWESIKAEIHARRAACTP